MIIEKMATNGSILANGRRSSSPDRRVTFGNIERYDILMSNGIRQDTENTISSGITKLDNQIQQAVKLGFRYSLGDVTVYGDVIDFLLDFEVIKDKRVVSERQIANIIQSVFHKVITRQSAAHSIIFVNLENCSHDIVKEELVRVTTEPVLKSYLEKNNSEAHAWINALREANILNSNKSDHEQIREIKAFKNGIENKLDKSCVISHNTDKIIENTNSTKEKTLNKSVDNLKFDEDLNTISNSCDELKNVGKQSEEEKREQQFDSELLIKNKQLPNSKYRQEKFNNENTLKNSDQVKFCSDTNIESINKSKLGFLKRVTASFSKISTTDNKKSVENDDDKKENSKCKSVNENNGENKNQESPKSNDLKKNCSNSQNSEKSVVGSVKDKFESLSNKQNTDLYINNNSRMKKSTSMESFAFKSARKEKMMGNVPGNRSIGGSNFDVRSSFSFERGISSRSSSLSATDVRIHSNTRTSFKKTSGISSLEQNKKTSGISSLEQNKKSNHEELLSPDVEADKKQHNETEKKQNPQKDSLEKSKVKASSSLTKSSSFNAPTISSLNKSNIGKNNQNKSFMCDSKRIDLRNSLDAQKLPRNQHRLEDNSCCANYEYGANYETTNGFSNEQTFLLRNKSEKTIYNSTIADDDEQHHNDLLRIARAFQNLENRSTKPNETIEKFMVNVVANDLVESLNERLKLDDLYEHIRNKISKDKTLHIRSKLNYDMSVYFEFLFRTMATHFTQVGCEITTDHISKKKVCFLIHIKLINNNDIDEHAQFNNEIDEHAQFKTSYV
ncbi:suppressor of Mek1 [Hydra vulgaris]|uniref:suppressor of Mek1 n=1 Tax=Hydra vulgaris TaxID=6087 RepID=UPI0006414DE1|nr:suppressor of Mek1 [Hydra vulgaris]